MDRVGSFAPRRSIGRSSRPVRRRARGPARRLRLDCDADHVNRVEGAGRDGEPERHGEPDLGREPGSIERVRSGRTDHPARPGRRRPGQPAGGRRCRRRQRSSVRGGAAGPDPDRQGRRAREAALPRHRRADRVRRRARPARPGLRPGLPDRLEAVRGLHGPRWQLGDRLVPGSRRRRPTRPTRAASGSCSSSTSRSRTTTVAGWPSARTATCISRSATAARGRSPGQRPEADHRAGQAPEDPARSARRLRTGLHDPRRRPVRERPQTPAPRSGPTACAIPGASRSIGRPATCGSATSARMPGRRST